MSVNHGDVLFSCGRASLDRPGLRAFAHRLQHEVAGGRGFTCMIARDAELQRLNRDVLGHDYPTDVLTFPSGARDGFLGEMAISVDRAVEQAIGNGHSPSDEIRILMLHGVLHLLGMDHESDRGRMRRAETRWRKTLALPTGLIERAHS
jgi:probable rRNA maturation factor